LGLEELVLPNSGSAMDKDGVLGLTVVIGATLLLLLFAARPDLVMLAIPLYTASGTAAALIEVLMVLSPISAAVGGGLLMAHQPTVGGGTVALAGAGMVIAWWGPVGLVFGSALLIVGAIALRLDLVTSLVTLAMPVLVYAATAVMVSPSSVEKQLAKTEARISEISGTLQWQQEWPVLKAERARLKTLLDDTKERFSHAILAACVLCGLAGLIAAAILKPRAAKILRGLRYGGILCMLLAVLALFGIA
jgi:hypothetical protein